MPTKPAIVLYESQFAPWGGITAVMKYLPEQLRQVSGLDMIAVTPFHHNIQRKPVSEMSHVCEVKAQFGGEDILVNIYQHEMWYFLKPEDARFFGGVRHPYDMDRENLVRDALFFGTIAAQSLEAIAPGSDWTLLLQDWQAATVALALAGNEHEHKLFLTLHNTYDSGAVGDDDLRKVNVDPDECPGPPGMHMATVLERALPLVERPVFTVSEQFARDITEDLFQSKVMADHLQKQLEGQLVGINNGLFSELSIPKSILAKAKSDYGPLKKWKQQKKQEALKALGEHISTDAAPIWGDLAEFAQGDAPWFVFAGRDDVRQKGYDVAAKAIGDFLKQRQDAKFLFHPLPGDEDLAGLDFLKILAERFSKNVLVAPFRFTKGYSECLQGAAYGVMSSLYEPFGMANAFYLIGCPGIARATGGLIQQIVPLRDIPSFSQAVKERTNRWHNSTAHPTGILYREKDDIPSAEDDSKGINSGDYEIGKRTEQREQYRLFRLMAEALMQAIADGVEVHENREDLYYRMMVEGIAYVQSNFSWKRSAQEYMRHTGL